VAIPVDELYVLEGPKKCAVFLGEGIPSTKGGADFFKVFEVLFG